MGDGLIFSSKRGDGLTARPYISYIDENGTSDKPFILPQNDPEYYHGFLKSFNIPEFSTFKIDIDPGEFTKSCKISCNSCQMDQELKMRISYRINQEQNVMVRKNPNIDLFLSWLPYLLIFTGSFIYFGSFCRIYFFHAGKIFSFYFLI